MLGTRHQFSKFIQVEAKESAKGQIAARTRESPRKVSGFVDSFSTLMTVSTLVSLR